MARLLPLLLVLMLAGCDGDTSVRACFGSDEFCDRVFPPVTPPEPDGGNDQSSGGGLVIGIQAAQTTAVTQGLALLTSTYVPEPLQTAQNPPVDPEFLGLWLGARTLAADMALEPQPDVLLDQLRVLAILQDGMDWPDGPAAAASLRVLGYRQLAGFSAERDPGTAELARAVAGRAGAPGRDEWLRAIAAGDLGFPADASAAELEAAALALLSSPIGLEAARPGRIAAATLLLLLSLEDGLND